MTIVRRLSIGGEKETKKIGKSRRSIEVKEEEFFRNARQAQTGARHLGINHRQGRTSKALDKKQMDG